MCVVTSSGHSAFSLDVAADLWAAVAGLDGLRAGHLDQNDAQAQGEHVRLRQIALFYFVMF